MTMRKFICSMLTGYILLLCCCRQQADVEQYTKRSLTAKELPTAIGELFDGSEKRCEFVVSGRLSYSIESEIEDAFEKIRETDQSKIRIKLDMSRCTGIIDTEELGLYGLEMLVSFSAPKTVTTLSDIYDDPSLIELVLPARTAKLYTSMNGCPLLTSIKVNWLNLFLTAKDGMLFSRFGDKKLRAWPSASGEVAIPADVKKIGECAFQDNETITKVVIPQQVTEIGGSAFSGCGNLKEIVIPPSVMVIGSAAFESTALSSVIIPDAVEYISSNMFTSCVLLSDVQLPKNLVAIDSEAFADCAMLKKIVIPANTVLIDPCAFSGCSDLNSDGFIINPDNTNLSLFENVVVKKNDDGNYAELCLPNSVEVNIPEYVIGIEANAFSYTDSIQKIHLPSSVVKIGKRAFISCHSLEQFSVDEENTCFATSADGKQLLQKTDNGVVLIAVAQGSLNSCTVDHSVYRIENYAFFGCKNLSDLHIENNVKEIGSHVFGQCEQLTSLKLPETLRSLGGSLFLSDDKTHTLYFTSEYPPDIDEGAQNYEKRLSDNVVLHVPAQSYKAYCDAFTDVWGVEEQNIVRDDSI
jgi:hypothetical protein